MVRRILHGVITSGLMDDPTPTSAQPIDYDAHAKVAQAVAERGFGAAEERRRPAAAGQDRQEDRC
ncbi:hypothetical protein ACRAWD_00685 [Caulobacter segnis]